MADKVQKTVDGVRAIELFYRIIRDISSGSCAFYQSQTRLNTPELGTLFPENFRDVSEITRQCINLFDLELTQALEAVEKFNERELIFNWMSVYMPSKYLKEKNAERAMMEACAKHNVATTKICFTLSEKLFEETEPVIPENIQKLRNRGFHFMVTGFGGTYSPIMRLSEYNVDYVMLSPEVIEYLGRDERSDNAVRSLIDFAEGLGATTIADGVVNARQAEALYSSGCNYCAGTLAGKYVAERFVRRRSEE